MWIDIAQTVVDGLMVGGLYATVAVGVTLVFGIMGILNFAHGQMVMLGAYIAYFCVTAGLGFWAGLDDLRVIADETQDGVEGYDSGPFMVLREGPVKKIDLPLVEKVAPFVIDVGIANVIVVAEPLKL